MSTRSIALEGLARWIASDDPHGGIAAFRRAFAAIWLSYDAFDVVFGATERSALWLPHPRSSDLVAVQLVLVAAGVALVCGWRVWIAGMTAAAARGVEALSFFPLNDFYFASVVYLLVAHSEGGPFSRDAPGRSPRWVRDALLLELAWVYAATAILKLSPDWLDGGHLYVRTQYLVHASAWPYPAPIARALASTTVDAVLAKVGVLGELTLAGVVLARRPYRLGVALAVGIHGFGTLATNVWFFSASMVAAVALLVPRGRSRRHPSGVGASFG